MIETPVGMLLKEFQNRVQFVARRLDEGIISKERARELEEMERQAFAQKLNELRVVEVRHAG